MATELSLQSFSTYIGEDRTISIPYTGGDTTLSGSWRWVATPLSGAGSAITKSTSTSGLSLNTGTGTFTLTLSNSDTASRTPDVFAWKLERTSSGLDTWSAKGLWTLKGA